MHGKVSLVTGEALCTALDSVVMTLRKLVKFEEKAAEELIGIWALVGLLAGNLVPELNLKWASKRLLHFALVGEVYHQEHGLLYV